MRRRAMAVLLVAGLAAPLRAEAPVAAPPPVVPSYTAQEDLNCAMWTATLVGQVKDGEMKQGLSFAMIWFIGRWEGSTGQPIERGLTAENILKMAPEMKKGGDQCANRMMQFGGRMQELGKKLQGMSAK